MTEMVVLPEDAEIIGALRGALIKLLPPEDLAQVDLDAVNAQTALLGLPVDSVVLMALMNEMEDRFTVFIPEEDAFALVASSRVVYESRPDQRYRRVVAE
ncbi:phosphopantetheine-binding protein [Mycobacteroides abscessus]|uniref:phosphopantetheine-binding protein n=1 Tax=Mycobacteroides abscessus TaxID=36809 RepID=UPI00324235A1